MDDSSSKPASLTWTSFSQNMHRRSQVKGSLELRRDTNVGLKTDLSKNERSRNFLIPNADVKLAATVENNIKGNLIFLRHSAPHVKTLVKNSRLTLGKPQSSSPRKVKHNFAKNNLHTTNETAHQCRNSHDERARVEEPSSRTDCGDADPVEVPDAYVPSFKPDERLQKWIKHVYKTRQRQLELGNASGSSVAMSSREPTVVGAQANGQDLLNHQPTLQETLRHSSFIKATGRTSSTYAATEDDDAATKVEIQQPLKKSPRTFRWLGFVIRSVVGLLIRMQKLSVSKTQQSAYSEFLYILAGPSTHAGQQGQEDEGQSLLFDKAWFSRTRAWSRMPTWAQAVMRLPPDERMPQDVQHLKQLLGNMRSFRENITEEMRTKLCQVVRYTRCDTGRVVFRQGHTGCDFYFIFSGSVFIQSESFNDKTGAKETLVENVLKAGEGFGEIALLGDGRRTASVICKEPTELCQIDKVSFLTICPRLFSDQLQERLDFARQFDIFRSWGEEELKQLCFFSQVLDVSHSKVIDKDWATSKFVYFIMKGRVSMLKAFDVTAVTQMTGQRLTLEQGSSQGSKGTNNHIVKQFASVGVLHAGDCTDLSVLAMDPRKDIPPITLISDGVRLFRVAVRTFLRMSPKVAMEEYLKSYEPRRFPSEQELFSHYLTDLNWSEFKKNIVHTHRLEKKGSVLASIPATLKGTSGWARWPGYALTPRVGKTTRPIEAVTAANLPDPEGCRGNDEDSKARQVIPRVDFNVPIRRPVRSRSLKHIPFQPSSIGC